MKLLSNRSYCNLLLKNYGRTILDCREIIKRNPGFEKAYFRWATSLFELRKYSDCIEVCDLGLKQHAKFKELLRIKDKSQNKIAEIEEKKRVRDLADSEEMRELIAVLNEKKVLMSLSSSVKKYKIYERKLALTKSKELLVPIVFLYPQFGQFDIVEKVSEKEPLIEAVKKVIGEGLPWDQNKEYIDFGEMEFYLQLNKESPVNEFRVEDQNKETCLFKLDKLVMVNGSLLQILQTKNYVLPTVVEIIVLSTKSSFHEHFLEKFLDYLN